MRAQEWFRTHSYHYRQFGGLAELGRRKRELGTRVSLVLPTANVADSIGSVLDEVSYLRGTGIGLIDQVIIVDADSTDGTIELAREYDVEIYSENLLMPQYGPTRGKGDAMWRSLSVADGDIIAFADTDTGNFTRQLVAGVVGCLLVQDGISFVKAAYRRPFTSDSVVVADGGGRVTELAAKPALNMFFPELAGFVQPLAGEFAGTRELLFSIPFLSGYAVEVAMMIDVLQACGLDAMAQVDVGTRTNRHQHLGDLSRMGYAVLRATIHRGLRLRPESVAPYLHAVASTQGLRLDEYAEPLVERPPMGEVLAELAGSGV